jgi:hypothetical protein
VAYSTAPDRSLEVCRSWDRQAALQIGRANREAGGQRRSRGHAGSIQFATRLRAISAVNNLALAPIENRWYLYHKWPKVFYAMTLGQRAN